VRDTQDTWVCNKQELNRNQHCGWRRQRHAIFQLSSSDQGPDLGRKVTSSSKASAPAEIRLKPTPRTFKLVKVVEHLRRQIALGGEIRCEQRIGDVIEATTTCQCAGSP
jgi:hypothetical protein